MQTRNLIIIFLLFFGALLCPADRIAPIVAYGGIETYATRLSATRELFGRALSETERKTLLDFLKTTPDKSGLDSNRLTHVKNDVANLLVTQDGVMDWLAEALLVLRNDTGQDVTWRDYCVQFLGVLIPRLSFACREKVLSTLVGIAKKAADATAGTAIVALGRNIEDPLLNRSDFDALVLSVISNSQAAPGARASAFGVCSEIRLAEAVPTARGVVTDSSQPIPVRLAALQLLGTFGYSEDMPVLHRFSRHPDSRLRRAANGFLRKEKP